MSFYEGGTFFACLIIALLGAFILGILEKPLKFYGLTVSLIFIMAVFYNTPEQFMYLIVFYFWEIVSIFGYLYLYNKYGRKENIYYIVLFINILPLILSKLTPFFDINIFCFLGISYLTFKGAQVVIEIYDGVIKEISIIELTGFLLFFPSISSGPIDRSRRFSEDWNTTYKRAQYLELAGDGIFKLLLGMVYKIVLAAGFYHLMNIFCCAANWYEYIAYAYLYGFYLFFDFAGYSLMAVGSGYILGVHLPDNFNLPFISVDIKEFWDRWHISLSHWLRDFVFSRFIMKCTRKKWFKTRLNRACAGFMVNMCIMGAWHELTPSYLIYGFYHGVLLSATEYYQKKSKFYKKNKDKKIYKIVSWFITMQLVMFGFFIFSEKFMEVI